MPGIRIRYTARRSVWIGALLALVCAGLVFFQSQRSSPGHEAGETAAEDGSFSRVLSARGVEYRRGDLGPWKQARSGDRLTWGDWIKSSGEGSAEIRFPDGPIFVLPPDTVGRLDRLGDRRSGGTPSEPAETVAGTGFQWIEGERAAVPAAAAEGPELVSPASDHEIDLAAQKQLRLTWKGVPAARRYALNVSSSPNFAPNIIEDTDRRKPSARIGIRREGVFYWRVATVGRDGSQGAWSETRSFRVTALDTGINQG